MTHEEFKTKVAEVIDICKKYNFMERTIHPYSFSITVEEFTRNWKDYDKFTSSSKSLMRDELKGFLTILDAWVKTENEPIVQVKCIAGKKMGQILEYHKSAADELVRLGLVELV